MEEIEQKDPEAVIINKDKVEMANFLKPKTKIEARRKKAKRLKFMGKLKTNDTHRRLKKNRHISNLNLSQNNSAMADKLRSFNKNKRVHSQEIGAKLTSRNHQTDLAKKHEDIVRARRMSIRLRRKMAKSKAYNRLRNSSNGNSPKSSGFQTLNTERSTHFKASN